MHELQELHLNLKKEYFEQIKSGEKEFEFREITPYWRKRLTGKTFKRIIIKSGYPKRGDPDRTLIRPWRGFIIKTIKHEHFGNRATKVFAIKVNDEAK